MHHSNKVNAMNAQKRAAARVLTITRFCLKLGRFI